MPMQMSRRAAIYANVSTDQQEREQNIESQMVGLQVLAREQGYSISPTQVYLDRGVSGSRLDRPNLDRLQDDAMAGLFEAVFVYCPERLGRGRDYQVVLLEPAAAVLVPTMFHWLTEEDVKIYQITRRPAGRGHFSVD